MKLSIEEKARLLSESVEKANPHFTVDQVADQVFFMLYGEWKKTKRQQFLMAQIRLVMGVSS